MISAEHDKLKRWVARLSFLSNTTLIIAKLVVCIMSGSVSILSEAVHSGIVLGAAGIAWYSVWVSGKPADDDHRFGHGKHDVMTRYTGRFIEYHKLRTRKFGHIRHIDSVILLLGARY